MKLFLALLVAIFALVSATSAQSSVCSEPHSVVGRCKALVPSWTFNSGTRKCQKFNYGGCGGNGNRFVSQAACERQCLKSSRKSVPRKA